MGIYVKWRLGSARAMGGGPPSQKARRGRHATPEFCCCPACQIADPSAGGSLAQLLFEPTTLAQIQISLGRDTGLSLWRSFPTSSLILANPTYKKARWGLEPFRGEIKISRALPSGNNAQAKHTFSVKKRDHFPLRTANQYIDSSHAQLLRSLSQHTSGQDGIN